MRIVREGKTTHLNSKAIYTKTCPQCKCKFEYELKDIYYHKDGVVSKGVFGYGGVVNVATRDNVVEYVDCPHCGRPNLIIKRKKKKESHKGWLWFIIFLLVATMVCVPIIVSIIDAVTLSCPKCGGELKQTNLWCKRGNECEVGHIESVRWLTCDDCHQLCHPQEAE